MLREKPGLSSKKFFDSLGEKDARRFAGILYELLGDMTSICRTLGVSDKTVRKGLNELKEEVLPCPNGQRQSGGGRKRKWDDPELNEAFSGIIEPYTAGDPMNPDIKWTNLSPSEIVELLVAKGFEITKNTVVKILKKNNFKKRKIQKRKALKVVDDRDTQFNEIAQARASFENSGEPIISVDTKKKRTSEGIHEMEIFMQMRK